MISTILNDRFERYPHLSSNDFIVWAQKYTDKKVDPATVSRHRAGTQGITAPWEIAYRKFFEEKSNENLLFSEQKRKEIQVRSEIMIEIKLSLLEEIGVLNAYLKQRGQKREDFRDDTDFIYIYQAKSLGII